jgi:hypothetical protein
VRKKLRLSQQHHHHQRGKESEVNLLSVWPTAAAAKGGGGEQRTKAAAVAVDGEEELTELEGAMEHPGGKTTTGDHDNDDEAVISDEEKAIAWRGEPVASDEVYGITYYDQFTVEPKGTCTSHPPTHSLCCSLPHTCATHVSVRSRRLLSLCLEAAGCSRRG